MTKSFLTAAASHVVSEFPLTITKITGEKTTANDVFIQIHQAGEGELVSGTSVPIASRTMYASDRFEWDLNPGLDLSKCIIVTSSTVNVYTTSAEVCTLTVLANQPESEPVVLGSETLDVFGNLTTEDSLLEIASSGEGSLYQVEAKFLSSTVETDASSFIYIQVFLDKEESEVVDDVVPSYSFKVLAAANGSFVANFGSTGIRFTDGMTVGQSKAGSKMTLPSSANTGIYLKVIAATP